MLTAQWLYGMAGCLLIGIGLAHAILCRRLVKRVLAITVMGAGVFMLLVTTAYRGPDSAPYPVPHALVLTGITTQQMVDESPIKPTFVFQDIPALLKALITSR